jgi:ribosomal protein S6
MRNYDLSVMFDSSKGEEEAKALQAKLDDVIKKSGGTVYKSEFIGRIDLANTFKKHTQAFSARIQYSTNNKGLEAINKEYKINEGIIRLLNTTLESVLNEEQIAELVK